MVSLIVGVAQVSLLLRHARSLKDKRHVIQSAVQKLRNMGFTVTECAYEDEPKRAIVGFAYVGTSADAAQSAIDNALKIFFEKDCEILDTQQDIFDFTDHETADFAAAEENDPRS